jgi:hypothetical protein
MFTALRIMKTFLPGTKTNFCHSPSKTKSLQMLTFVTWCYEGHSHKGIAELGLLLILMVTNLDRLSVSHTRTTSSLKDHVKSARSGFYRHVEVCTRAAVSSLMHGTFKNQILTELGELQNILHGPRKSVDSILDFVKIWTFWPYFHRIPP